jgi:hypothetical protein
MFQKPIYRYLRDKYKKTLCRDVVFKLKKGIHKSYGIKLVMGDMPVLPRNIYELSGLISINIKLRLGTYL